MKQQNNVEDGRVYSVGLTSERARELAEGGFANVSRERSGKSYLEIIRDNLFTYFNMIWAAVAVILILVGSASNLTFLAVIIPNLLISTIQEIRAKAAVERLSVTTEPRALVVRDGRLTEINSKQIVLGDVMKLSIGKQILSDAIVTEGSCEVNESLLTGESVPVKKAAGDRLLAGSFLVSGEVLAEVDRVGKDNYVHKIEKEAKAFKKPASNLFHDLNSLIMSIGAIIIPIAAATAVMNWVSYKNDFEGFELVKKIVEMTAGSVVGMIPAGIYLLITLTLSLSVITLARKKTLVQDMYSIEMLASADVICLDKTGTITDGTMRVSEVISLDGTEMHDIVDIVAYLEGIDNGQNQTSRALSLHFGRQSGEILGQIPFSSDRKFSAANIAEVGCYAIGAPHFVPCYTDLELDALVNEHAARGERVLLLSRLESLEGEGLPVALIAIEDTIRPNAKETIARFQNNGVAVKVISGDHARTVASIAERVGIRDADKFISCEGLSDEELVLAAENHTVFGRVTPEQKVLLIKTLKQAGHTVAMTGDGVNDTLALKEANCAIAMADGSEVARKISQIVLTESDFGALPAVVTEGRRCINNVRQSATLFLMKTIFTILISLFSIVTAQGYPFAPNNFLFLELFVIGLASVLLAVEPNDKRIEGSFIGTVFVKSVPCALAMFIPVAITLLIGLFGGGTIGVETRNSVAMCVVTLVGFINLIYICRPYTKWRTGVVVLVGVLLGVAAALATFLDSFMVENQVFGFLHVADNPVFFGAMLALGVASAVMVNIFRGQLEAWAAKNKRPQSLKETIKELKERGGRRGA
ncbi:MAG: HAD-IC family P-type ATPase [Clostridia bacterium]|nr:HAD-IC family P-type ATPase [Clostridia bacterium]